MALAALMRWSVAQEGRQLARGVPRATVWPVKVAAMGRKHAGPIVSTTGLLEYAGATARAGSGPGVGDQPSDPVDARLLSPSARSP